MISSRRPPRRPQPPRGRAVAGAESSWRPPWFESATASTPACAASFASATVWIPLQTSGPSQIERNHSTSRHERPGIHLHVDVVGKRHGVEPSPTARPTTLANRIGSAADEIPGPSRVEGAVEDGAEPELRRQRRSRCGTSRSPAPSTGESTVSTSASYPARRGALDHLLAPVRGRGTCTAETTSTPLTAPRPPRSSGCRAWTACTAGRARAAARASASSPAESSDAGEAGRREHERERHRSPE